jgi:hypothetical protein
MLNQPCPSPSSNWTCRFPASSFLQRSSLLSFSEPYQSELPKMRQQCASFGDSPGRLASPPKVLSQPVLHLAVDPLHGGSTMPFAVIVLPFPQVQVEPSY